MSRPPPSMKDLFGGGSNGGFLGLPLLDPGDTCAVDLAVIGIPAATPYPGAGNYCADAPEAVRAAFGWPGVLEHHDFDLGDTPLPAGVTAVDLGNLDYSDSDFAANREAITSRIGALLDAGSIPFVIGGDDSVPIPVLQAYRGRGPLTILQLDAHIDWRDEVGGEKFGLSSNMRRASEMDCVDNIVQLGARGIGSARPQDRRDALDWGAKLFPMRELARSGIDAAIAAIPEGGDVYIAFDIDAMDPAVVPAVIGPAPGGFSYWQAVEIFEATARRARIVGFNLTELMPAADIGGRGALLAARLLLQVLGLAGRQIEMRR